MKKPEDITKHDWQLLREKYVNLEKVVEKIEAGYPVQYLIGHVNFCGLRIDVNKHVLIPRFETEYLIEKTINYIDKFGFEEASLIDIGTGSGCIAIALKKEFYDMDVTAIDISAKAINLAKKNAKYNKCKINFIKKNMFKYNLINKYNVLISNPPYMLETDDVDPKLKYEPSIAIYGGLEYFEQIFKIAKESLYEKYLIALEIHEDLGKEVLSLAKKRFPKAKIKLEKDLTKKDRYLFIYSE